MTSDGGALLLHEVDGKINLLRRLTACFADKRSADRFEHPLSSLLAQRIFGLALGYEDLNDHEQLRNDPLFGVLSGKRELDKPLAGKSTLNRLELSSNSERYRIVQVAQFMSKSYCTVRVTLEVCEYVPPLAVIVTV